MATFEDKFIEHVTARSKMSGNIRVFETCFVEEDNNSYRFFNYNHRDESREDEHFRNGFHFAVEPQDEKCVPEYYVDNFDLFRQFYCKLVQTDVLKHYIKEIKAFFEPESLPRGCYISTKSGKFPSAHGSTFNVSDLNFTSPKVNSTPGGGIDAKHTIKEGEIIIKEKAAIVCTSPPCVCSKYYTFQCDYCTKNTSRFYVCHNCSVAIYCTENCRAAALLEYHEYECRANKFHFFGQKNNLWVAFRMIMVGSLFKFNTKTFNKYQHICQTTKWTPHANKFEALRGTTTILIYLMNHTNYFKCTTLEECYPKTSLLEKILTVGGNLFTHALQAQSKTLYFPNEMISLTSFTSGTFRTPALCVSAAKCNHSCKPNAAIVFVNNYYYIKALRKISRKESITINYVHLDEFFYAGIGKCTCYQCATQKYFGKMYVCYECGGKRMERLSTRHKLSIWMCNDCYVFESNEIMEEKVVALKSLLKQIKGMDEVSYPKSGYLCNVVLTLYDSVYSQYYPEWLYIVQRTLYLAIQNLDLKQVQRCSDLLFKALPACLNKFSFQRMDILASMVNSLLKKMYQLKTGMQLYMTIAEKALKLLEPLCNFYMIEEQYIELKNLFKLVTARQGGEKDTAALISELEKLELKKS